MKKLVFALSMFIGAVAVNAQDTTSTTSPTDPTSTTESSTTQPSTTTESSTTSTTTQSSTDATSMAQQDGRVQMKSQDLPEGIKEALEGQGYTGWLISSAYKVDGASGATGNTDGSTDATNSDTTTVSSGAGTSSGAAGANAEEMYIVVLKNGAQTKTVRFDKEGKELDDAGLNDQK